MSLNRFFSEEINAQAISTSNKSEQREALSNASSASISGSDFL
jgi:hypothetical protein